MKAIKTHTTDGQRVWLDLCKTLLKGALYSLFILLLAILLLTATQ